MRHPEHDILDLMRRVWAEGDARTDRTGIGTRAIFGAMLRFDLSDGTVPLMTTKRVFWKVALKELIWFLSGETSIRPLIAQGVHIWTDWPMARHAKATGEQLTRDAFEARVMSDDAFAAEWGDLGPVYGYQWRRWPGPDGPIDQIAQLVRDLRETPTSRRLLFTGWNVADLPRMALPPCHMTYQYFVENGRLHGLLFQRSCDLGLGFPFNIFEAALLVRVFADIAGLQPGSIAWMGGDVHLYENHAALAETQLAREPRPWPKLRLLARHERPEDYRFEDFAIDGYDPLPAISAPVAV
ncbi:MAG: thymidylate synthase [Sphingomonadaceae bacterium]|nr:thymidylate synthase [Sphingomonadaceae bacterium]